MKSLNSVREAIEEADGISGVEILGTIIQWTIPQDVWVSRSDMENNLLKLGMKSEVVDHILPQPVSQKKSFRRSIQMLNSTKRQPDGSYREYRKIQVPGSDGICYGCVEIDADGAQKEFDLKNEGWVALVDGSVKSNVPTLLAKVESGMSLNLGSYDLREMLSKWARFRNGFATRPNGGTYFVPKADDSVLELDVLQKNIADYTKTGFVTMLPILGGAVVKKQLQATFTQNLLGEIDKFKRSINSFFADDRKKQKGSTLRRLEDVKALKSFALSYECILDSELKEINEALDELDGFVETAVAESIAEHHGEDADEPAETVQNGEGKVEAGVPQEEVDAFLAKLDDE